MFIMSKTGFPAPLRRSLTCDMLELGDSGPVLQEEVGNAAHVRPVHQEVRRESHAADDVIEPSLWEYLGLPVFRHHALALQAVQLDLALISKKKITYRYRLTVNVHSLFPCPSDTRVPGSSDR